MRLPPSRASKRGLPPWLFSDGAGVQISGDSGSGKSNALEVILERIARTQAGLLFIDPHGTSAKKLRRMILNAGPSVAKRLVYIHPASVEDTTQKLATINPLFVPGVPGTLRWKARLAVVVDIVGKILLAAWGETDFSSKPILFKNVTRILTTLAYTGLSLADAKLFLDLLSPAYRPLVQACPDLIARNEMDELPDLRVSDRLAQIESAKNRFLGLLSNPVFEAMVGRSDGALDFQRLYDERALVIVNLELGGVLRPMDQEILANLFLTLAVFTILNAPAERRYPYFLALDELPVFASSFELLEWLSGQTRKFLARLVVCHQGVNRFPDRGEDRLLHAITSQCRSHLFFRHGSPVDAEFFGRILALPEYTAKIPKHIQTTPMQFQVGHRLVVLTDESEGLSESSGTSDTSGTTDTTTNSTGDGDAFSDGRTLREAVECARSEVRNRSSSRAASNASGSQRSATSSQSQGRTHSVTRKQSLVPIIETRSIVTGIQFYSKEELEAEKASGLTKLKTGEALLYITGTPAVPVKFPLAVDPYARTPVFGAKKETEHQVLQECNPAFATVAEIHADREALVVALVRALCDRIEGPEFGPPAPLLALTPGRSPRPPAFAEFTEVQNVPEPSNRF